MKKRLLLLISIFMIGVLTACGKSVEDTSVELIIPASFFSENITQEELDKQEAETEGVAYTLNEDGTVLCKMTKETHETMIANVTADIDSSIEEMLADKENYPTFTAVTMNDKGTEFTIKTTAGSEEELSMTELFANLYLSLMGGTYQVFAGVPEADRNIIIHYVNDASGQTIYTYDASQAEN